MSKEIKIQDEIIAIEDDYNPLQDSEEDYMSLKQKAFFKDILLQMRLEIVDERKRIDMFFQGAEKNMNLSDDADVATYELEISQKTRERERGIKKERKILDALNTIESGEYGYCKDTGDAIGLKRLLARPFTNLSVQAQEERDLRKKEFRKASNNEASSKFYTDEE